MPKVWPDWARLYLGDRNAEPTPVNQEIVARSRVMLYWNRVGDWRIVASMWRNGPVGGRKHISEWSNGHVGYVDKIGRLSGLWRLPDRENYEPPFHPNVWR